MNRQLAPLSSLPRHLSLNAIHKEKLANNLSLYVVEANTEDLFQLNLVFKAGRYFESKRMLAGLCANMILKGTKNKKAYEIAENFDFYGAAVKFEANMYSAQLSLYCLCSELPKLLPLLIEVIEDANFPLNEIKKAKAKTKQKLAVQWKKNAYIANQEFNQILFGKDHAFGYLSNASYLEEISQNDLLEHYKNYFSLKDDNFAIVAGSIGKAEIALLQKYLGSLSCTEGAGKLQSKISTSPAEEIRIEIPKALQTAVRVGKASLPIDHPDFENLQILNTILGGYFGSRLMSNIREEKGYTYGIYSFVNPIMDCSYFCISTEVGSQYKNQTLDEIEKEMNRLKEEPISEIELSMVKNYMIGQLMKSVDGPLNLSSTLKNFLIFDLEIEEINKQLEGIHKITAQKLQELAQKHLNFNEMHKVLVG
ncbi:MAG: insulinase family protein [Chitinophagales bacterium]|nr:insulinase family protein [Chitinophagales bacterium]